MANPENLTPEARSKGGKISAERRRAKKQMAEELKQQVIAVKTEFGE